MKQRNLAAGYTLIEIQVTLLVIGIVAAISVFALQAAIPNMWADAAMDKVVSVMRLGRDAAITQRRRIQVLYTAPNRIDLLRMLGPQPFPIIGTAILESNPSFMVTPNLGDTPDGFGIGLTPFSFGNAANIRFNPDGTLTDFAGVPVNGTIFIGSASTPLSARAVTITGVTGRAQPYRWNGNAWEER